MKYHELTRKLWEFNAKYNNYTKDEAHTKIDEIIRAWLEEKVSSIVGAKGGFTNHKTIQEVLGLTPPDPVEELAERLKGAMRQPGEDDFKALAREAIVWMKEQKNA